MGISMSPMSDANFIDSFMFSSSTLSIAASIPPNLYPTLPPVLYPAAIIVSVISSSPNHIVTLLI